MIEEPCFPESFKKESELLNWAQTQLLLHCMATERVGLLLRKGEINHF